jgi:hypothetical protein
MDILVHKRHVIADILKSAWPDFPPFLLIVGGTASSIKSLSSGEGTTVIDSIQQFLEPPHARVTKDQSSDDEDCGAEKRGSPQEGDLTLLDAPGAPRDGRTKGTPAWIELNKGCRTATPVPAAGTAQMLPIWRWVDESCSLDSTLLVAVQICETLPGYAARQVGSSHVAFQTLYSHFLRWSGKATRWQDRPATWMTGARNSVRKGLGKSEPPVNITKYSTLDDSLYKLIPEALRQLRIQLRYSCANKACVEGNIVRPGHGLVTVTVRNPDCLYYPADYQRGSDTQTLLDKVVCACAEPR